MSSMSAEGSFEDERPYEFSGERVAEASAVTVRYAGRSYEVPFVADKTAAYYLKEAGDDISTGLFGTGFASRQTASINGERISMRSTVTGPCTITVNSKVSNG